MRHKYMYRKGGVWRVLLVAALCVGLGACSDDSSDEEPDAVRVLPEIPQTEATRVPLTGKMQVFMLRPGGTLGGDGDLLQSAQGQLDAESGSFQLDAGQSLYYLSGGAKSDFIAYYPAVENLVDGYLATFDCSSQSAPDVLDVMWGKVADKSRDVNAMSVPMERKMIKLVFHVKGYAGAEELTNAMLADVKTKLTLNVNTGEVVVDEHTVGTVNLMREATFDGDVSTFTAILPAQQLNGNTITVQSEGGTVTLSGTLSSINTTEGGSYGVNVNCGV